MAMAFTAGFRWLDLLETEFDKAFVELDTVVADIDDEDTDEIIENARAKMATLSSAFAQLVHKSQTIFQNNAKLEAQIVDLREEIVKPAVQVQSGTPQQNGHIDWKKRCCQFESENTKLRECILALQGELYGARLAARYLDKELAGRIQQLQLMSRNMKHEDQKKLWNQLESEIFLHRHKTVIRACQGHEKSQEHNPVREPLEDITIEKPGRAGVPRTIKLTRHNDNVNLGLAVTGGEEHGVPILISKIYNGSIAHQSGKVFVGDAILSVNGINLRHSRHADAVRILNEQKGDVELELLFVSMDGDLSYDQSDSSMESRFPIYSNEVGIPPTDVPEHVDPDSNSDPVTNEGSASQRVSERESSGVVRVGQYTLSNVQNSVESSQEGYAEQAAFNCAE